MAGSIQLLKHGRNVTYQCCDACMKYVRALSRRGWCDGCEEEYRVSGLQKVAEARVTPLSADLSEPLATLLESNMGPASPETPPGSEG